MFPSRTLTSLLAAGALIAAAPTTAVAADQLVTAAPGAKSLASGGGYLAWAAPADGGYRLTVRAADGSVTTPDVPAFDRAPTISIGSSAKVSGRTLVAVYDRDGDVYELDLAAGTESKVAKVSTGATESSPQIVFGDLAFVRRGAKGGIFVLENGKVRRISRDTPSSLAFNGSRIAYPTSTGVRLHRISGRGEDSFARTGGKARFVTLTRYSVTYMTSPGRLFQTTRFGGSSDTQVIEGVRKSARRLPASTNSFTNDGSFVRYYLDADGVKRITRDEDLFRR